jgi:hypothetical protein
MRLRARTIATLPTVPSPPKSRHALVFAGLLHHHEPFGRFDPARLHEKDPCIFPSGQRVSGSHKRSAGRLSLRRSADPNGGLRGKTAVLIGDCHRAES